MKCTWQHVLPGRAPSRGRLLGSAAEEQFSAWKVEVLGVTAASSPLVRGILWVQRHMYWHMSVDQAVPFMLKLSAFVADLH
jgi:hypothetical protein